jgi:hypothetical protein
VLDTSSPAQVHEVNRIAISDKGFNASSPAVRNNHLAGAVSSKSTWKAAVITNGQLTQQVEIKDMAISMKFASESRLIQNVFITNTTVPVTDTKVISGQVQLVPGFVYSSTFELRLQDMSGQQPQLLDKVSATGSSSGYNMLWADKNSLYVIPPNNEKGQTIDVYDISSDKLVRRSTIPIGDAQTVVATAQDTRFFFDTRADRGSVVMVDLSDPANPKRFPEVQLAGHYIAALSAGGGYLYVATDNAGLNVLAVK